MDSQEQFNLYTVSKNLTKEELKEVEDIIYDAINDSWDGWDNVDTNLAVTLIMKSLVDYGYKVVR